MSRDPSHVFLSGSTGDFKQVRLDFDAALSRGGCHVVHQDEFPQTASDTLLKLAQLIAPCGLTVHMIGEKPGSSPTPGILGQYLAIADREGKLLAHQPILRTALGDFSTITYTQWEAYIAIHLGMPLLVYADASYASPHHPQRAHLDRLQEMGRYATSFDDHSILYRMVMADLMAHFRLNAATANIANVLQPSNLPGGYIGRLFLGRDQFLETLHQSLQAGKHATAITQRSAATGISGLGGIGKTHAAVEYANRHRADYTALLFASADTPEKLNSSLANLCRVLHLDQNGSLPPDEPARVRAALDWLSTHSGWLLILDSVDGKSVALAVREILGQLTAGHLVITSRLHDWTDQFKIFDLDVLSEDASSDLLLQLTENSRHSTDHDDSLARELVKLLDGLPLAIHQAAGFINEQHFTFAAYHIRYQEEAADLLNWFSDLHIVYERPEKLAPCPVLITWKTSFDKLSEQDRFWLLVFSHFAPDPIPRFLVEAPTCLPLEQAVQVNQAWEAVSTAGKYSLITFSTRKPFFKIHRLVQLISRLQTDPTERPALIGKAISLIRLSSPGGARDARNWDKWNQLQPHAISLCVHAGCDHRVEHLGWLLGEIASFFHSKALHRDAAICFRRALVVDRALYGAEHVNVAARHSDLARFYKETGHSYRAKLFTKEASEIYRANLQKDGKVVAAEFTNLALLLQADGKLSKARKLLQRVVQHHRESLPKNDPELAVSIGRLGQFYLETGQPEKAKALIKEAKQINISALGSHHPEVANNQGTLARIFQELKRYADAETPMRDALAIDRTHFKSDHPNVAIRLNNLALLLGKMKRLDEAIKLLREALEISKKLYGDNHPDIAIKLNNLAGLLEDDGHLIEAMEMYKEALAIDDKAFGPDHQAVGRDLNNLAQLLKAAKRLSEAEPPMREALRVFRMSLGADHPSTLTVSRNLNKLIEEIAASR
ncbi:MAG: FxSxx-COOH system tetratricopeptide repeat protein [Luteolibacter sp.]|uniref:FxSxx-COOH system tetratricopeptide repeat protein n=1 Tax=Luteolibacter sp. TaxID=1962973 RepID=UPI00326505A3